MKNVFLLIWLIAATVWLLVVAYTAHQTWPVMSLDLGNDAGTRAAYDNAVMSHALFYSLMGVVPPFVALALLRMFSGLLRRKS